MTSIEKYNYAFVETFNVSLESLNDDFHKDSINNWDSVHQLNLTLNLEESFDIMFDPEDIMDFTSYSGGKEIMSKYGIKL